MTWLQARKSQSRDYKRDVSKERVKDSFVSSGKCEITARTKLQKFATKLVSIRYISIRAIQFIYLLL